MIFIGAASPGNLTGTEAGIAKPLRLDWDAAPFLNFIVLCLVQSPARCPRDPLRGLSDSAPEIPGQ